jgi:pyruvate formate lyase activating enzyme
MKVLDMNGTSASGIVFDIQRASLHDGPGIRTTVFLKGCPLRCVWCHNPEANKLKPQLFFNSGKCIACGACVRACQHQVHRIDAGIHIVDYEKCSASGDCVRACDQQALKITGQQMSVSDVMEEVLADLAFYEQSGGGLTISGGEPLMQFSFTLDLVKAAKKEGVHICVETSGFCAQERFEEILPYVDLFLFDYKVTGSEAHQSYTGVSSEQILSNLDYLYQHHASIILRCPMIPEINATKIHFEAISELGAKYPKLAGVEILPYHDMGNSKRASIGVPMTLVGLKSTPPETTSEWLNELRKFGCDKAQIG